ncbi:hypothetical protein D1007_04143 [Hordeum vulgare]|nr:hypothetical protein D1007_04143 [Hordeum vulgare]
MSNMMDANNTTLDNLMTARADGIRGEIALDLDQIRADLYKTEAVDPNPKSKDISSSRNIGTGRGTALTSALGFNNDHRGKAHNIYVPPPVRGNNKVASNSSSDSSSKEQQ